MNKIMTLFTLMIVFTLGLSACQGYRPANPLEEPVVSDNTRWEDQGSTTSGSGYGEESSAGMPSTGQDLGQVGNEAAGYGEDLEPEVTFTLKTALADGRMAFQGVGGDIDGQVNPNLQVAEGTVVQIILENGDGVEHDFALPDLNAQTELVREQGKQVSVTFVAGKSGEYLYFCSVPGHRQAGMEGRFIVGDAQPASEAAAEAPSIVKDPTDLPGPLEERSPQHLRIDIETVELEGRLADGTTFTYWTFNGTVPGPFLRVRVGDTVDLYLTNRADSTVTHSIDLHAVTGPGGGAAVTQAAPGEEKSFTFQALNPGLYVYHCATPMVAHHISNGMYGLILVEPEGGLPPVDREFYVMQGEMYTGKSYGTHGHQTTDIDKLVAETPEYFVFNGAVGGLTTESPLKAHTGETVRIFFGVGGPNFTSSFHVIGEILDRVYDQASLTANPLTDVQTTLVPAGGATMVEFKVEVPGRYILVDHSLSRMERGLVGHLVVEGDPNHEVFFSEEELNMDGH